MGTVDQAHLETEKILADLENRISKIYDQAARETEEKVNGYFQSFAKRDEEQKEKIGDVINGKEYTENDYKQWRLAQIGRGKRLETLRDQLAERMTNANEVASSYINDYTPGIYSLNRNFSAYTIEKYAGDIGFTVLDEQTVKRLITESPDLMPFYPPERAVNRGIDLAWGKKQITSQVTSGILQGESIKNLSKRLQQNIPNMNKTSAIRAARTAVTGAQNGGRLDSYEYANEMGIEVQKEWLAVLDGHTRDSHIEADGEVVETDSIFSTGCMYPGDPGGPPAEVYNCRCTMIAHLPKYSESNAQRRARDPETGENVVIEDMTYNEWYSYKKTVNKNTEAEGVLLTTEGTINKAEEFAKSGDYDNAENLQEIRSITNKKLGYDKLPTVVSASDFKKLSNEKEILYRGVKDTKEKTASEIIKEFKNGIFWTGNSGGASYGNGVYFTFDESIAKKDYADTTGKIMEIILDDSANVVDYKTILKEYVNSGIPGSISKGEKEIYQKILSDVGQYAAVKGYDAIALNGFQKHDYTILLNRKKAIIKG